MSPLHIDLLDILKDADRFGFDTASLLTDARRRRHRDLTEPQLEAALRDLADASFVAPFTSPLGKKRWRITTLGLSAFKEEGL